MCMPYSLKVRGLVASNFFCVPLPFIKIKTFSIKYEVHKLVYLALGFWEPKKRM